MSLVAVGFSLIFWGFDAGTWQHSFEVSGSSLTTLGFSAPIGAGRVWLSIIEAIIGLGLVALLITYLPTIYAARHSHEKGIMMMRPFAGTPASAVRMILALQRVGVIENDELWRMAANWVLELDQTHTDFPALCYFPEAISKQSWVATTGCILDGAAFHFGRLRCRPQRFRPGVVQGSVARFTYGIPALGHIARAANLPVETTRQSRISLTRPLTESARFDPQGRVRFGPRPVGARFCPSRAPRNVENVGDASPRCVLATTAPYEGWLD